MGLCGFRFFVMIIAFGFVDSISWDVRDQPLFVGDLLSLPWTTPDVRYVSPPRIHDPTRVVFDEPPICVATANFDLGQRHLDLLRASTGLAQQPVFFAWNVLWIEEPENGDGVSL